MVVTLLDLGVNTAQVLTHSDDVLEVGLQLRDLIKIIKILEFLQVLLVPLVVVLVKGLVLLNQGLAEALRVLQRGEVLLVLEPDVLEQGVQVVDVDLEEGGLLTELEVKHLHVLSSEVGVKAEEDRESYVF